MNYTYEQLDDVIAGLNQTLIMIAGASASGKTHIAQQITDTLTGQGKKVLLVSADNYYKPNSWLQAIVFGTFDHVRLIDHELLTQHITSLLAHEAVDLPTYSFVTKNHTYQPISGDFDHIIVEGLYVINELPLDGTRIFVDSPAEDLLIRRLVRDPARTHEPLKNIIDILTHVFPMRTIMGYTQSKKADIHIDNTFEILDTSGISESISKTSDMLTNPMTVIDYMYNDDTTPNDGIYISERYMHDDEFVSKVTLSKIKKTPTHQQRLTLELSNPGALIQLHTLVQLAGCTYMGSTTSKVSISGSTYQYNDTKYIQQNGIQ